MSSRFLTALSFKPSFGKNRVAEAVIAADRSKREVRDDGAENNNGYSENSHGH